MLRVLDLVIDFEPSAFDPGGLPLLSLTLDQAGGDRVHQAVFLRCQLVLLVVEDTAPI